MKIFKIFNDEDYRKLVISYIEKIEGYDDPPIDCIEIWSKLFNLNVDSFFNKKGESLIRYDNYLESSLVEVEIREMLSNTELSFPFYVVTDINKPDSFQSWSTEYLFREVQEIFGYGKEYN